MKRESFSIRAAVQGATGFLSILVFAPVHAQESSGDTAECVLYQGGELIVTVPGPCDPARTPTNSEILSTYETGIAGLIHPDELERLEEWINRENSDIERLRLDSLLRRIERSIEYYQLQPDEHAEELVRLKALENEVKQMVREVLKRNVAALPPFN